MQARSETERASYRAFYGIKQLRSTMGQWLDLLQYTIMLSSIYMHQLLLVHYVQLPKNFIILAYTIEFHIQYYYNHLKGEMG